MTSADDSLFSIDVTNYVILQQVKVFQIKTTDGPRARTDVNAVLITKLCHDLTIVILTYHAYGKWVWP